MVCREKVQIDGGDDGSNEKKKGGGCCEGNRERWPERIEEMEKWGVVAI